MQRLGRRLPFLLRHAAVAVAVQRPQQRVGQGLGRLRPADGDLDAADAVPRVIVGELIKAHLAVGGVAVQFLPRRRRRRGEEQAPR